MEYNRAKEEIVARWEDIITQITSPAKEKVNHRTSYICPLCGHGTHGDGLTINPQSKDGKGLKCFGCDFSGDIIDLVGAVENIEGYPERLKRAGEYIGITIDGRNTAQEDFSPASRSEQNYNRNEQYTDMSIHTDTYTQEDTENYISYYRECKARLSGTDYHTKRGISEEVANRFMLGYEPHYKVYNKERGSEEWQALIIPTGYGSYVARNTDPQAKDRYRNTGKSTPLNTKALQNATQPIYIVEGEIDALSIIEAGGEAIGLGSSSNVSLFIKNYIKPQKPVQPLVLALDNDEKGQRATDQLEKELTELGIDYYSYNPAGEHKDPNEALLADRKAFIEAVTKGEDPDVIAKEEYYQNTAYNYLQEFINGIADSVNTPATPTGFFALDEVLDGGLYEGLYIIGAISSLGKTTLALQIADQIAQSGRDVLIFSLEMARAELMSKSISRLTYLDENRGEKSNAKTARGITAGARYENYSQIERELIQRAISAYGEYANHIIIHEGVGDISTDKIRSIVRQGATLARKEGKQPPVVFIDYVQILSPHDPRATDKQNMDRAVTELKRISRDYKTPVIGISSLNRANYKTPISMEALKETGGLEYGSDVVIGLQLKGTGKNDFDVNEAKRADPREIELVILKNRNGRTGDKIAFDYYPLFNYFEEA